MIIVVLDFFPILVFILCPQISMGVSKLDGMTRK